MRTQLVTGALIASALAIGCANLGLSRHPDRAYITADERMAAIRHAQVWRRTDIRSMNVTRGPQGKGAFAPNATVTCRYYKEAFTGTTPKFGCELPDDNRLKVRYGRDNNEIFAGVAATRLFWALGFGADVLYPVHVICRGCPSTLHGDRVADGEARFDYAAIERKMPGREMEAPSVGPGWAWPELDRVDERAGGAPLAHRDALKLLAVMLQHTDNKAEQQKLICVDEDTSKHELGTCPATFMLIHDLGLTFGTATLVNSADRSSANLREWSRTPIWKDEAHCVANMPPSQSGTLINPIISEVGRSFLSDLLGELTDTQIQDLFLAARFGEKPGLNGESGGSVADWAAAFKRKRDEIAATSCF
ncbi:MAG TPA: hypothetical protein VKE51_09625 [Vicinamibacterales bacterium]|nr:hypothetical protein [Vicinamibacterales bacterium]